ncbi:MAG TPA: cytochrome P450, partial [Acidimicrobiales bacterium]|nr:cytochrome P450 [Acidimicrobiales bacterium]
ARAMFLNDSKVWKRPPTAVYPIRLAVGGDNLFTQSQREWSMLQPSLAPDFRKRALEERVGVAVSLVETEEVASLPYDTDVDLERSMGRIALMFASSVLFGRHLDRARADELLSSQRPVIDWLAERMRSGGSAVPVAVGRAARTMQSHRARVFAFLKETIDERRAGAPQGDVLDALLAARPHGRPLPDDELTVHMFGLFAAGNETTATALSWALVHGASNRAAWAALRSDASSVPHFVTETLRLSPPAWGISRSPAGVRSAPLAADGMTVQVRPHQMVMVNVYGMGRDQAVWPDGTTFDPDRHRRPTKAQERSLIPFGLGLHGCIGQQMAMAELQAVLPMLARHGNVEVDGSPTGQPTFTLKVRGGLRGKFAKA